MSKPNAKFISVAGEDLQTRLSAAHQQARPESPYWVAYRFPVRPDVSVDSVLISGTGLTAELGGVITGNVGQYETRHVGLFVLYKNSAAPEPLPVRAELYDLERERDYEGHAVYWLGEAETAESLNLLESLLGRTEDEVLGDKLAEAVAIHSGGRTEELLAQLARRAKLAAVRARAVFYLGRLAENLSLVEEVAGDGRENLMVRQQAIMGIGKSRSPETLDALRRLAGVISEHSLREAIVNAVAKSRQAGADELLKSFSETEADAGLKRRAEMQLFKGSGKKRDAKAWKQAARARKDRSWRLWK